MVDKVDAEIANLEDFIRLCKKRSVFKDNELKEHWDYKKTYRPFVVNFLYIYSFPRRPNLEALINMGIIRDTSSVPRGFEEISSESVESILKASESDESFIIN